MRSTTRSPAGLGVVAGVLCAALAPAARADDVGVLPARLHLPGAGVFAIHQARDHILWIGTDTGFCRHDGVRFDCVDLPEPLRGRVSSIETAGEAVWVAASEPAGILAYDAGRLAPRGGRRAVSGARALLDDGAGGLWIGGAGGLTRLRNGTVEEYGRARGLPPGEVRALLRGPGGALWVGGAGGLHRADGERFAPVLPDASVTALAAAGGRVWVGTAGRGLFRWEAGALAHVASGRHPFDEGIAAIAVDAGGRLWIGAPKGLFRQDGDGRFQRAPVEAPPDLRIESLLAGDDGVLWVGTDSGGLAQLHPQGPVRLLGPPEGLAGARAFAIAQDAAGGVWMTTSEGLSRYQDGRVQKFPVEGALASNDLRSIAPSPDGHVWIAGLSSGLVEYDGARFVRHGADSGLPTGGVRTAFSTRDGRLLLALRDGGLAERRGSRFVRHPAGEGGCAVEIGVMADLPDGGVLMGTEGGGVCRWDGARLRPVDLGPAAERTRIHALLVDADGTTWVGTRSRGLLRARAGRVDRLTTAHGLPSAHISQILAVGETLWITTPAGIASLARAAVDELLAGAQPARHVVRYGAADGLRSTHCTWGFAPAGTVTRGGALWIPTGSGVAILRAPDPQLPRPVARAAVHRVVIDGEDRGARELDGARLVPPRGNLELFFSAPLYRDRHRLELRHRLVGLYGDWTPASESGLARYANVPPGRYTFEVAARFPDAPASEARAALRFELLAPWWRRGWARVLFAAVALAGIAAVVRLRGRQARRRMAAILDERQRIARDLHDTLEQSLVGVKMQIEAARQGSAVAGERLERAAALVDRTMDEARASIWALRAGLFGAADLPTAVSVAAGQALHGTPVRFALSVQGQPYRLEAEAEAALVRVAQAAVANAVRHARATRIEAGLAFDDGALTLRVRDDGVGFAAGATGAPAEHHGLTGMSERLTALGGTLALGNADGGGAEITAAIPARWRRREHGRA